MSIVRKIVAVIVMIVCVIMFVASVGGVFGAWWANAEANRVVTDLAGLAASTVQRAQETTTGISTGLDQAVTAVETISATVQTAGQKLEDNNVIATAVGKALDTDLSPVTDRLPVPAGNLVEAVKTFQATMDRLDKVPFLGQQSPKIQKLQKLDAVLTQVEQIGKSVRDLKASMAAKKEVATDMVPQLTAALADLSSNLAAVKGKVGEVDQALTEVEAAVPQLQSKIMSYVNTAAIGATVLFAWLAVSQVSLFLHALAWFKGKTEEEASAAS
jgi:hypothetical protein